MTRLGCYLSNEKIPGCRGYIGDVIFPSYVGPIFKTISHAETPMKTDFSDSAISLFLEARAKWRAWAKLCSMDRDPRLNF